MDWKRLTTTERRVVELVCEGLTNREIGDRMTISPRTVQGHLLKVFRKLGVSSRTRLVILVGGNLSPNMDKRHMSHGIDANSRLLARRETPSDDEHPKANHEDA